MAKPGTVLRKLRADMLRQQDRVKLEELNHQLKAARARRAAALKATSQSCRKLRTGAKLKVEELRRAELARLKAESKRVRQQARNECQARKHRIRKAGGKAVAVQRALLKEERDHQAQQKRLAEHARLRIAKHKSSKSELRQESDDHVRGNLPAELVPVFNRVQRQIKGTQRRTRTEAFLEWAEAHPEDVQEYQQHETDRAVARLVAEHEATQRRLRKGAGHYRQLASGDVPF